MRIGEKGSRHLTMREDQPVGMVSETSAFYFLIDV